MIFAAIGVGLLIAFAGHYLAFVLAGGGHGWIAPFWASAFLWLGYPMTLVRAANLFLSRRPSPKFDWNLVILALFSDAFLIFMTTNEGVEYFLRVANGAKEWTSVWIVIWLGWQFVALLNLARAKVRLLTPR